MDRFFGYARERYEIFLRQKSDRGPGLKKIGPPWTDDPILLKYRFCNVFREDDKTTRWFNTNVRGPLQHDVRVVLATYIFRWFNRIETGEILFGRRDGKVVNTNLFKDWDPEHARARLTGVKPLVTGAYMIKTPTGVDKLTGILKCIETYTQWTDTHAAEMLRVNALQKAHQHFMQFPFIGSFMAYELVTDLRHTDLLRHAKDINSWAAAGPGAARGLARITGDQLDHFKYNRPEDQEQLCKLMHSVLELSRSRTNWPREWPAWEMREVEHTLCEFDKYERVRLGEGKPKQLYRNGEVS